MKKILISIINFYRKYISVYKLQSCKFYPTCSQYTAHALEKHGAIKGLILGIKRILRCHPFSSGGYDPLR